MSDFRMDLHKGKVVLVTGGGTGIGLGICTQFARHGAAVVMTSRRQNVLDEACGVLKSKGYEAYGISCDVRDPEKCQAVVAAVLAKYGRLDVLVNNAAGNFMCSAEDLTANGFKTVMDIDLHGSFNMASSSLEALKVSGKGVIINITATLHYKAAPFQMHSSAAKAGIDVMTRVMGVEWAQYGIRTCSIAPGPIDGTVGGPDGRVFSMKKAMGNKVQTKKQISRTVPIGRYGTVDDIANTAMFVASDAGSFITATQIVVDGGHWHGVAADFSVMKKFITRKSGAERADKDKRLADNMKGGIKETQSKL